MFVAYILFFVSLLIFLSSLGMSAYFYYFIGICPKKLDYGYLGAAMMISAFVTVFIGAAIIDQKEKKS